MSEREAPTAEQCIEWAREAHIGRVQLTPLRIWEADDADLVRFAAIAHAAGYAAGLEAGARDMRERCAELCEAMAGVCGRNDAGIAADALADRIRALPPPSDSV